jgi:phage host-nuclease inhibitor protein Gam
MNPEEGLNISKEKNQSQVDQIMDICSIIQAVYAEAVSSSEEIFDKQKEIGDLTNDVVRVSMILQSENESLKNIYTNQINQSNKKAVRTVKRLKKERYSEQEALLRHGKEIDEV